MRFLVIGRAIDSLPVPPEEALAVYGATFEKLAAGAEPRIAGAYPFAGERATAFMIEADSAEELDEVLADLPGYMLSTWEVHPLTTVEHVASGIRRLLGTAEG